MKIVSIISPYTVRKCYTSNVYAKICLKCLSGTLEFAGIGKELVL